jgi:integrase
VTTGTLEKFYSELKKRGNLDDADGEKGLADSTVRSIHAHCLAALEKAKNDGLISKNPAKFCRLPPKKNPEVEVLTPAEMQRLLIQAKEDGFYEMFLLDLATGLRRGELLGLQWDDIDWRKRELRVNKQVRYDKKVLKITEPKTKAANRTIVLPKELIEVLKEYRKTVNSNWLFPSPVKNEDVPRDPTACRKSLSKILERAGCKHVPFHAQRHTFATQSLRYGMDIKTLASVIGHESVETTLNVYSHVTDEGMRTAAKTIDRALSSAVGAPETARSYDDDNDGKPEKPPIEIFEPYKGKKRKPGTGYVKQLSVKCWQGRYTPTVNGKRISHNVYGATEAECEARLAELITRVKAEYGIA